MTRIYDLRPPEEDRNSNIVVGAATAVIACPEYDVEKLDIIFPAFLPASEYMDKRSNQEPPMSTNF